MTEHIEHAEQSPSNRRFTLPVVVAAVLMGGVGGVILTGLLSGRPAPGPEGPQEERLPAGVIDLSEAAQMNAEVVVVEASATMLPATRPLTGVVAPDESRVAHVRPLARGVIETVAVSLGDRVRRGQPLVTYDNIELGELVGEYLSASAAVGQAEADLDVRERYFERAAELIKLEAIAQQTLELREAEFRNAQAGVTSQQALVSKVEEQLHRFGLTDEDLQVLRTDRTLHREGSLSILRAPFDGIVTQYEVAVGELVEPDRELFTITDINTVWVLADVYERDLTTVRPGLDVEISAEAYPGAVFQGQLTYVSDLIDPATRTAKVRCVVPNPDGALKLNMFVKVGVPTGNSRQTTTVPAAAVQQIDGQAVVFVQLSTERFEQRAVILGETLADVVEVLSGLDPGEAVVADGSFYLKTALLRERIGDEH